MNVITWNMQGATGFGENKWRTDAARLFHRGAQVLLLQECGAPPRSAQPAPLPAPAGAGVPPIARPPWPGGAPVPPGGTVWDYYIWSIGSRRHPCLIGIYWLQSDPGGNRCNLAIATVVVSGAGGAVVPTHLLYVPPPAGGGAAMRPAIGVRVPAPGGARNLFTLHAISPLGPDAPGLLANCNVYPAPWFVAGDFNRLPATWGAGGGAIPGGAAGAPNSGDATHPGSGTNLDYGFISPAPGAPPAPGLVMSDFVVSDHYPVLYVL